MLVFSVCSKFLCDESGICPFPLKGKSIEHCNKKKTPNYCSNRSSPTMGLQSTIQQHVANACRKTPDDFFEKGRAYRGDSDYFEKPSPNDSSSQIGINGNALSNNTINGEFYCSQISNSWMYPAMHFNSLCFAHIEQKKKTLANRHRRENNTFNVEFF